MGLGKLADLWTRLSARRVRLEKPAPGIDWAEGALASGVRVGEWRERIGSAVETTDWLHGKKHGPSRRVRDDGALVLERGWLDGELHGNFRSFHDDGSPLCICVYDRGRIVGRYELRAPNGVITAEGDYLDGARTGEWIARDETGTLVERDMWSGGRREGPLTAYWEDGTKKFATTYRAGEATRFEIWTRAAVPLGEVAATTPKEAELYLELAEALEAGHESTHQVLRRFSKTAAADAVAMCEARGFSGLVVFNLDDECVQDAEDPRVGLVSILAADHRTLPAALMVRLRESRRLRCLDLYEMRIEGSLAELFAPGAKMPLAELGLVECEGDVVAGIAELASSDLAERIVKLSIDQRALEVVVASTRFRRLAELYVQDLPRHRAKELSRVLGCKVTGGPDEDEPDS